MRKSNWIKFFIIGIGLSLLFVFAINYTVDPFGVFGDKILNWYSYDMTQNPRIAKVEYFDRHAKNYDSIVIGSSKSSPISPDLLNEYIPGSSFYNMFFYGGDMKAVEDELSYLTQTHKIKNIVLSLGLGELVSYDNPSDDIKQISHYKALNNSPFMFYLKFLTLDLKYSKDKIAQYFSTYKSSISNPTVNTVFKSETGVYNKVLRDKELFSNTYEFVQKVDTDSFKMNITPYADTEKNAKGVLGSVKKIKKLCDEKNINLIVISAPNYYRELDFFDLNVVKNFWKDLSQVTEFWNFSGYNHYSYDVRYFYDMYHFRNSLGELVLAKVFNNENIMSKIDFGYLINSKTDDSIYDKILQKDNYTPVYMSNENIKIPILLYHNINYSKDDYTISPEMFRSHMIILKGNGFTPLFFKDLIEFTKSGKPLPEKPILVTFDDGYYDNYFYGYNILKELNIKANIFIIGWSFDRSKMLNSDKEINRHFGGKEGREMLSSGLIDIQSHTFDMHDFSDSKEMRKNALKNANESIETYTQAVQKDINKMNNLFLKEFGYIPTIISYPFGLGNVTSDQIFINNGYQATVLTNDEFSYISRNDSYSLYGLKRVEVSTIDSTKLLSTINNIMK